jgi:ribonuclease P protein component
MLPKEKRLRKNRNFDSVYKKGRCYPDKDLLIYVLANDLPFTRCGFSISKKVSKKAVERNKLKRQLSFIFRDEAEQIKNCVDIVFVARKNLLNLNYLEIRTVVKNLLDKAKLYNFN